jgi:hypothetical protein
VIANEFPRPFQNQSCNDRAATSKDFLDKSTDSSEDKRPFKPIGAESDCSSQKLGGCVFLGRFCLTMAFFGHNLKLSERLWKIKY